MEKSDPFKIKLWPCKPITGGFCARWDERQLFQKVLKLIPTRCPVLWGFSSDINIQQEAHIWSWNTEVFPPLSASLLVAAHSNAAWWLFPVRAVLMWTMQQPDDHRGRPGWPWEWRGGERSSGAYGQPIQLLHTQQKELHPACCHTQHIRLHLPVS